MKAFKMLLLPLVIAVGIGSVKAQEDIATMLKADLNDAKILAKQYANPFGEMFGNSLNAGWYNSAKPHGVLGFDITFNASIVTAPSSAKKFDVSRLNLNSLSLKPGESNFAPTIAGSKGDGPVMVYSRTVGGTEQTMEFALPPGAGIAVTPMPMIQAAVGLPFNTEIIGRFFPKVEIPDVGRFSMWGIGAKNEFKEFIPGFKMLPINVSFMIGYTQMNSEFDISYKPDTYVSGGSSESDYNNQKLALNARGYTARLLVGKSIPVLTVYAGVGYSKSVTDIDLKGRYPGVGFENGSLSVTNNADLPINPLSLGFDDSGVSFNAGLRIKLAIIAFHFDYTLGKYPMYNAGVGINFR